MPAAAFLLVVGLAAAGCGGTSGPATLAPGDAARGALVFAASAGCGCHTPEGGPVGAGGGEVPTPFGTFYGTNITPDEETGIGAWNDAEIDAALRRGVVRGRGTAAPVMPYYRYSGMTDRDAADLIAYLRALPSARRANREHDVRFPLSRLAFRVWRVLFGDGGPAVTGDPRDAVARGRYLVDHVGICGDCHTPRNALGAPERRLYLAGASSGPDGAPVPNITPDAVTGIGDWTAGDIATLLETGIKPDFDNVQGIMAALIDGHGGGPGFANMVAADREAIGAYLRTVPAVANEIVAE
jgi:mono/diheme cytochrome c family protein